MTEAENPPVWLARRRLALIAAVTFCMVVLCGDWMARGAWAGGLGCLLSGGLGLYALGSRRWPLLGGGLALVTMVVAAEGAREFFGYNSRFTYVGGAVLLGWLFGMGLHALRARTSSEGHRDPAWAGDVLAERCALGVLCALYVNSGCSKWIASGFLWIAPENLAALITAHALPGVEPGFLGMLEWVVVTPAMTSLLAGITLLLETGAFMMLFGGRIRAFWAFGLFAMHVGIGLLTGTIWYVVNLFFLLVFAFEGAPPKFITGETPAPGGDQPL